MPARTSALLPDKLIYLIRQGQDDIFDPQAVIEYDEEFMNNSPPTINPLEKGLDRLLDAVISCGCHPGGGNHPEFLHILEHTDQRAVPSWPTLQLILDRHPQGYPESA